MGVQADLYIGGYVCIQLTVAAQQTLTSYRWPSVSWSRTSHVGLPYLAESVGNWASRYVRTAQLSGVKVSTCRSSRFGCVDGMLMLLGAKKMAFSVFADASVARQAAIRVTNVVVCIMKGGRLWLCNASYPGSRQMYDVWMRAVTVSG